MATLLNSLIRTGFVIEEVYESAPDAAWLAAHPDYAQEQRRPMFLLVSAKKGD